jgi:hypothetical protein
VADADADAIAGIDDLVKSAVAAENDEAPDVSVYGEVDVDALVQV